MSSQPAKTTPSKGFTCDCKDPNNPDTTFHKSTCWKVPKCEECEQRTDDDDMCDCMYSAEIGYRYYSLYDSDPDDGW